MRAQFMRGISLTLGVIGRGLGVTLRRNGNDFKVGVGCQHAVEPNQIEPEGSEIERKGVGGRGSLLGRRTPKILWNRARALP